jgi:hypothetical protein
LGGIKPGTGYNFHGRASFCSRKPVIPMLFYV